LLAVTSFHPAGWTYAQNCLKGLAESFPGRIVAYAEEVPEFDSRIELRDFYEIKGVNEYLEKIKRVFGANGHQINGYDYRFDANKFCRKVFAQDAVFDEDQYVFWIDADCVFFKPIEEEFLVSLVKDVPFAYMGRGKQGSYVSYTETGFLGFNTKHKDFPAFRAKYLSYFTSGRIFQQLRGWHDCIAFDHAREGIKGNNLSPNGQGMNDVLRNTVLAPYMEHLKGRKKFDVPPNHALDGGGSKALSTTEV
jgi:hypothetical protein